VKRPGTVAVLVSAVRRQPFALAQLAGWSVVDMLPAVLSGYAVAHALDDGFLRGDTRTGLTWLGALAVSILVGSIGTRGLYGLLGRLVEPFRDDLVRRVVTGVLRRSTTGGMPPDTGGVGRLTQQVEIVRDTFAGMIVVVGNFAFAVVGALIGLLALAPIALVFVVPPLVLGLIVFFAALAQMAVRQRRLILADERIAETASTMMVGLRDVVACGGEERIGAMVGAQVDAQEQAALAVARLATVRTLALAIGGWVPLLGILAGAPWLLRNGASTGAVVGAFTYVAYGLHPALQTLIQGVGGSGLRLTVTLRRILEMETAGPRVVPGMQEPSGSDLQLRRVTFGYGRRSEPVVTDLTLEIPEGDHVAIVGPSGIGKSTLAGLMTGLLAPQDGEVRIGGVPIHGLDAQRLARHRVLIPQEAYVFAGTVRDNLTYLRPGAGNGEIDDAVDAVGLRPLVTRLGGLDQTLDPSALSAGERQLIALTRAYLSPARLVLLDEATCHLDPVAELRAEQAFAQRPGTLIVIAHRVTSALRARRIIVMDGTRIADGSHAQLLDTSPLYRDLVGHWTSAERPPRREIAPLR
jgi:ATP-binding cassette subfamily C protein